MKFQRDLDKYINKTLDLGLLKIQSDAEQISDRVYEVKPIIKAKISVEELSSFKEKLEQYVESV